MTGRRRQVFDPSRLDDIDDLLPPPPMASSPVGPPPLSAPAPATERHSSNGVATAARPEPRPTRPSVAAPAPRQPKGQGGRPATRRNPDRVATETAGGARVAVPVRIPPMLYNDVNNDLLSGPERPSYGQLVIWTCEDHAEEVVAAVRAARPSPGTRRPRGHTLASEGVQITLRLTTQERAFLDGLAEEARPEPDAKPVTRTEVAIAALRLALAKQPD